MRVEITNEQPEAAQRAAFYSTGDDERAQAYTVLAREALKAWDLAGAQLQLIKQRENAVFGVIADNGGRAVLRIHRAAYHSDAELRSELAWMAALSEFGVPTPPARKTREGDLLITVSVPEVPESRQVDLLEWVDGEPLGTIEGGVGDLATARDSYYLVGNLVARMHDFAATWPLPRNFRRHAWDIDGLLGEKPFWGRFWELGSLSARQRERLLLARELARDALSQYGQGADRFGLIHADPLPENFLRSADGTVRVIDFDDGGFGWFMFDFATALFFFVGEDSFDDLLASMIDGYVRVRPLPPEFEQQLSLFLLLRGCSYLGWVNTREDSELAREITPMLVEGVSTLAEDFITNYPHVEGLGPGQAAK